MDTDASDDGIGVGPMGQGEWLIDGLFYCRWEKSPQYHEDSTKVHHRFYWPQLRRDVENRCHRCEVYAISKMPNHTVQGPLLPSQVDFPIDWVALNIFDTYRCHQCHVKS